VSEKLKAKKSAGPDNLKPEFYKALLGNEICFNTLLNCFNNLRDGETVPDEWKKSKTVMLPKVSKPQPKDLRPIALTNVSYKIFMAAMKNKIELHLANNDLLNEMQAGFTDGRRIENNLYILKYCIESCFERNLPLFLSSVDYHKAFDSINRGKMIQAMKYYKAHFKDIDKVAEIYQGDKTFINFGEIKDLEIEISSGIRQGCTGSTTLFKLITYKIMEKMEKQRGFVDDMFKINMLYFADDGLQLSLTRNDAARNIKLLIEASREWGLEVNEAKCNIIIYNLKLQPTEIQNIKVVKEIKYLGITLSNGRDCFKKHKELMIDFGKKMANLTYPVISKSCNKLLIGKVYWKSLILPKLLYGAGIMDYSKTDILNLGRVENIAYRSMLGAPKYAPVTTLRGEIGSSSMEARIMETRIKYIKYTIEQGENSLLGRISEEYINKRNSKWSKASLEYFKCAEISFRKLKEISPNEIKNRIKKWDTLKWREEMEEKSSLTLYRQYKSSVGGEDRVYDNRPSSIILYKARANVLPLNDRNRFQNPNASTTCSICNNGVEDLAHFILWCSAFNHVRMNDVHLQQPYIEDENALIGNYLFKNEDVDKVKITLHKFYRIRTKMLKNLADTNNVQ